MKKVFIIPALAFLFFTSCEQDATIDLPESEAKLVLSCYLTPQDTVIRAIVTMSNPVFNSSSSASNLPVTDATVTLFGNSSSVQLIYNPVTVAYEVPTTVFPVFGGNEYRILVTDPTGKQVEAATTVPLSPPAGFQCTATDSVYSSDPFYEQGESRFSYNFNDPAGAQNFYRFVVYNVYWNPFSADSVTRRSGWDIFSDENADGTNINRNSTTYYYTSAGSGDSLMAYEVWMLSCNYDYYTFHRSLYNYNGGDPFSEPTLIYTNVVGGLGIFAGANGVKLRIPQ